MGPPLATGLAALDLSDSAPHKFAAALQGMVAAGVSAVSPSLSYPTGNFAILSLLYLCFAYGVAVDGEIPPIWEAVALGKRRKEGLANLNQFLMRGLPYCRRAFRGRSHFSASLPLISFVKT